MIGILSCHLQLKVKNKTECIVLMDRLFVEIKHLPLLSTVNLPLVEYILKAFYHLPVSLVLFRPTLLDVCEFAKVGLNYTLN